MYVAYHLQHIVLSLKGRAISLNTLYMPLKMDNHICETPILMGLNRIEYIKARHIKVSMPLKKSDLFSDLLFVGIKSVCMSSPYMVRADEGNVC